jgi:hypothetical protein
MTLAAPRRTRRQVIACAAFGAALLAVSPWAAGADGAAFSSTPGATPTTATQTDSQREAAAIFKAMTQYVAGLKTFSLAFRDGYDVVQPSGQKIEFGETRRITIARPDRMRVEEVSSDGFKDLAVFDGRTVSVLDADANVYAQAPQPGGLDDALVYFVRDLRMRMPLALLLTTRLPAELAGRIKTLDYVERTDILGVATHHIAGRTDNVDFQFWIADDKARPVPLRVLITYVHAEGQPQFWADIGKWNMNPALAADTFKFEAPKGARKIAFAVQLRRPGEPPAPPAARGEVSP